MVHSKPSSSLIRKNASYGISFSHSFTPFIPSHKSRLGDVEGLADHEASVGHEDESGGVELEYRTFGNDTERNLIVDPALADPVGDQGDDAQGGGSRETFKVFGLAVGILGYTVGGNVEASKTEKTAEGEGGEKEVVKGSSHANCDRCDGRGDTEGDLQCCGQQMITRSEMVDSVPNQQANRVPGP